MDLSSVMPNIVGTGAIDQIIQSMIVILFMYVLLGVLNNLGILYFTWLEMSTTLMPDTSTASETYTQEPNIDTSKTCYPSKNEINGTEFTYACFLNFRSTNFTRDANSLRHVFHKGSPPPDAYPLISPGVFTLSDKNTLRIYMGSSDRWDNYVDIPNIPVEKWFHLVITLKGRNLDVYINGNVIQRMTLATVPKLNFGDVYVFQNVTNDDTRVMEIGQRYNVNGKADGMISRFFYYAYSLSYSEIDNLYRQGPSSKIVSSSNQLPPYMADAWWVQSFQSI
jgi:hypothetical protein